MYFHPGFAARNAITAIELAQAGACGSEHIIEGPAGIVRGVRPRDRAGCDRAISGRQ